MPNQTNDNLPTILVIFGATGDLTRKKLVPALFHLYQKKLLPPLFQAVAFSRRPYSTSDYRRIIEEMVVGEDGATAEVLALFSAQFMYSKGVFEEENGYARLLLLLGHQDTAWHTCANKLFYLATPPESFEPIAKQLAHSGLMRPCSAAEGWTRVIVEKPFGKDYATARRLEKLLSSLFKEEQIYRIDHYLGKETAQNILAFRFANAFLNPSWNSKSIESISIRLFEKGDVGDRGDFYETVGALRDVGQNHLLQLLALFTMETPRAFDAASIRAYRARVLQSLQPFSQKLAKERTARAQYEGYRKTAGVAPDSETETYFRIEARLDTRAFNGVPIYLESGKAMDKDAVEVTVMFRHPTPCLCPPNAKTHYRNTLHYRIQPEEQITLSFWVKKPGKGMQIEEKQFIFNYRATYPKEQFLGAYEKLLLDAIAGNQTLFVSAAEIMASWKFIDSVKQAWLIGATPLEFYPVRNNTPPSLSS